MVVVVTNFVDVVVVVVVERGWQMGIVAVLTRTYTCLALI
jgi:hypothetical protein